MGNNDYDEGDRVLVVVRHGIGFKVVERELLRRQDGSYLADGIYLTGDDYGRRNFVDTSHIIKGVEDL